jgi:hypothetical protein
VLLQAYTENETALRLYTELGFRQAGAETDLRLDSVGPTAIVDAPGYQIRPWRPADGMQAHDLARSIASPAERWLRPLRADEYRPDWWARLSRRLKDILAGRRLYQVSMLESEQLVALLTLTAAFRSGCHRLALLVHPDHAGLVEAALLSRALHLLSTVPPAPVRATVNRRHDTLLDALRHYGFRELRTLLTLRKDF